MLAFLGGLWEGIKSQAAGLWHLITNPIDSGQNLYKLAEAMVTDPEATLKAIAEVIGKDLSHLVSGSPCQRGVVIGQYASPAVAAKVVAKLARFSDLPKVIDSDSDDAGDTQPNESGDPVPGSGEHKDRDQNETPPPEGNHAKAAFGERVAHQRMLNMGYDPLGKTDGIYRPGQTGIDGVYRSPDGGYVIIEAKFGTSDITKDTKGHRQMSEEWLFDPEQNRLEKAGLTKKQIRQIERGLKRNGGSVEKLLIKVDKHGRTTIKRLGEKGYVIDGKAG